MRMTSLLCACAVPSVAAASTSVPKTWRVMALSQYLVVQLPCRRRHFFYGTIEEVEVKQIERRLLAREIAVALTSIGENRARGIHGEAELGALVGLGDRVAGHGGGETALWADRQPVEIDVFSRCVDALAQAIQALEHWRLAADQAQHDAFVFRHEAKRLEIARTRRVVFQQEMVDVGVDEESLGHGFVAALPEVVPLEVAPAHMDAEHHVARGARHRLVDGIDVMVDELVRCAAGGLDLAANRRIAEEGD